MIIKFNEIIDKNKMDVDIEYPDEFLDPITYSPIETPFVLPNGEYNILIDKSTIQHHLLDKQENPFTREPLTMDKLEEYNKHEPALTLVKDFNDRFNQWKNNNSA